MSPNDAPRGTVAERPFAPPVAPSLDGRDLATILLLAVFTLAAAVPANADYAVLRSGQRLRITGYELRGAMARLTVEGGSIEIPAGDLVAIEPEEVFTPAPPPAAPDTPYRKLVHGAAQKIGLDADLLSSVIAVESNFNARAASPKSALGLMQLLPETAARYGVSDPFDPAQNINAGARYLKDLLEKYDGELALALAAYNAGPERVAQYGGIPPFRETRSYVRRITSKLAQEKRHPTRAAAR